MKNLIIRPAIGGSCRRPATTFFR